MSAPTIKENDELILVVSGDNVILAPAGWDTMNMAHYDLNAGGPSFISNMAVCHRIRIVKAHGSAKGQLGFSAKVCAD